MRIPWKPIQDSTDNICGAGDKAGSGGRDIFCDRHGFRELIRRADQQRLWVKLSAPYRTTTNGSLRDHAGRLLELFGPGRLLWGSDWPWTQYEEGMDFSRSLGWLEQWVPDRDSRDWILGETPARLFGLY